MYNEYTNYITTFIDSPINEWTFKSHPSYQYVLEHVNSEQGYKYLLEIQNKFGIFFNTHKQYLVGLCITNDLYGNTNKFSFENFALCSPTNLRYILHGLLILSYIHQLGMNNVNIIEIGGGYGGLCFFIYKMAWFFNITIKTYNIFDLPEPMALQKKYLKSHGIENVKYMNLGDFENVKMSLSTSCVEDSLKLPNDCFLVSNYAYSEISMDLQKKYTDYVLNPYVSHGFLAWNSINVYNFIENKQLNIIDEFPLTGNENNKYVRF
jgi:hypothetical protein